MEFEITSIELFGIKISEPVTSVTDLLVSAVCLYAFFKLRKTKSSVPARTLFTYYFLAMSLSTTYGGFINHAFLHLLSFGWKVPAWLISMVAVALMERAAIFHGQPFLKKSTGRFFAVLNIIELITLVSVVLLTLNFFFVELHAGYGLMVIVFSFELFIYRKTKQESSRWLLMAVGVSAVAAVVHIGKLAPHTWFNHLDLSHVLMAIASYLYFLGAMKLADHVEDVSRREEEWV
jgi:hypothetical protein